MALPGWLIKGCTCELRWVIQKTPLNSNGSKLLSLLGDALSYKALGQIAWTSSLCVEALSKKIFRLRPSKKREGKEPGWERIDDFWFLGSSHWDLCICSDFVSWIPRIISMSLPFPWSQLDVGSSQLWFRICSKSFPIIIHLPDSNRDTNLFQQHYEWNPLFFNENRVCNLPNTVHQHRGKSALSVSDFLEEPYWFLSHTKDLHCLCQANLLSFPHS